MKKKRMIIMILIIIAILALILGAIKVFIDKSYNHTKNTDEEIQKLYEYGDKLEEMDILPNTIVARLNGEEVLFHEIESYRKSINYSIENGSTDSEEKSAFYEVLVNKLYAYLAKEYPNESTYSLNIESNLEKTKDEWENGNEEDSLEEYRKKWLAILAIEEDEIWLDQEDFITYLQYRSVEQMLSTKGMNIVFNFMINKPELANDKILEEKIKVLNELKEQQKKLIDENKQSEALELSKEFYNQYNEIRELYVRDLIINSDLELCVDKGELSRTVPTIYREENNDSDTSNNSSSSIDTKNYSKDIKIAYQNDKDKENSEFVYLSDTNKDDYNWNEYIVENKTILKDMPEIDFTQFKELGNDFYCLKITDYNTYKKFANNYNLRKLDKNDFDNIFAEMIIRKNSDNSIEYEDIIKGYEFVNDEENYTLPITVGGMLDVSENFKYPCMIGYFPNYMNKHYDDFYFKILATNENIAISKDKAIPIAQNCLKNLTYGGCSNFSDMDYVRIEKKYGNNFLNTDEKENPIDDTSKEYTVWSISAYSENDPCTWANVYVDVVTGKIIGGNLNFATD